LSSFFVELSSSAVRIADVMFGGTICFSYVLVLL
jgi:hypothetical protein